GGRGRTGGGAPRPAAPRRAAAAPPPPGGRRQHAQERGGEDPGRRRLPRPARVPPGSPRRDEAGRARGVQGAREALLRGAGQVRPGPLTFALALALGAKAWGASPERAARLIDQWRFEEAAREVEALVRERPEDPAAAFLEGELRFQRGDYAGALE